MRNDKLNGTMQFLICHYKHKKYAWFQIITYNKFQWILGLEGTKDDLLLSDSCMNDGGYVNSSKNGMAKTMETS